MAKTSGGGSKSTSSSKGTSSTSKTTTSTAKGTTSTAKATTSAGKGTTSTSTAKPATTTKATTSAGKSSGFTSLTDMIDGGGPGRSGTTFSGGILSGALNKVGVNPIGSSGGKSGTTPAAATPTSPTAANRPMARPEVLVVGTGKDRQYIDTSTGERFSEPEYSPLSLRGLTSTDPANVARNRAAAAQYEPTMAGRTSSGPGEGIASLVQPPAAATEAPPAPPPLTQSQLAAIGAPTTAMGPVEVATPSFGMAPMGMAPVAGYGSAFGGPYSGLNPYQNLNLMDIFSMYPGRGG